MPGCNSIHRRGAYQRSRGISFSRAVRSHFHKVRARGRETDNAGCELFPHVSSLQRASNDPSPLSIKVVIRGVVSRGGRFAPLEETARTGESKVSRQSGEREAEARFRRPRKANRSNQIGKVLRGCRRGRPGASWIARFQANHPHLTLGPGYL